MNRGEQLTAGYKKASLLEKNLRGTRHWIKASLLKKEAVPGDIYSVSIPPLTANECIVPDTMALSFKFNNSNTKSWFLNNLGRLLVDQLCIKVQGVQVYQNTGESMLEVYKDLWRSDVDRENRQQFGIANENVRKLISKDDSADKAAKTDGVLDTTVAGIYDRMKIPLGKILCDNGPYAPYGMCDFVYDITLPMSKKIMKAQTNEETGTYKLTDLQLEYDVIKSAGLAESVRGTYNTGRSFPYNHVTILKSLTWRKDSEHEVIDINLPRKSLKAIVLLFTEKGSKDSEHFPFPNLTNVRVDVQGIPDDIYSVGLAKRDMYDEAVRFFNNDDCEKYLGTTSMSCRKYYTDKFACVIDFRTVDDNTVSGSGRNLIGVQAGILMKIEKEATTTDLMCHVFLIADGAIDINGTKLNGSANY